jgi:hypothetical protein
MDESDADRLLTAEKAHDKRTRAFCALLAAESGLGTGGLTVVGGSAIEIYTEGEYVSADLDLVVDSRARVTAVLARWGFKDEGKLWSKKAWDLYPDVMEQKPSGSWRLTQIVSTSLGSFRIIGVEDLIVRRVRESIAWQNREEAFAQAILLARHSDIDAVDWEYIRFFANREGWLRQLAELRRLAEVGKGGAERHTEPSS